MLKYVCAGAENILEPRRGRWRRVFGVEVKGVGASLLTVRSSDQVCYELLCLVQAQVSSIRGTSLIALIPNLVKVLLQIALILLVRELLPIPQHGMGKPPRPTLTQHLLVFNHISLLVPSLFRTFIELHFEVPVIVVLVVCVVIVAYEEVVVVEVAFAY